MSAALTEAQQGLGTGLVDALSSGAAAVNGSGSAADARAAADGALTTITSTLAQMSALDCAVVWCGSGRCVMGSGGPVCDCEGTNMTGPNCNSTSAGGGGGA